MNWPQFAIVNLKSVKQAIDGWYEIDARHGQGQIKMMSEEKYGILDHIWKDPEATWTVYMRVIPSHEGAVLINTFFRPEHMDDMSFDNAMKEMDIEFHQLKRILEK